MSDKINITCETSSGKIKCRYKRTYSDEIIPKGEPYINVEAWDAGGSVRIAVCKKHIRFVKSMFDEAVKNLYIRNMTGL